MNSDLLNWAIETYGTVEFDNIVTPDGIKFRVIDGNKKREIWVNENTTPEEFIRQMRMEDLRDLTLQLERIPDQVKLLKLEIKRLKKQIIESMR